jgi:hypothetical protein
VLEHLLLSKIRGTEGIKLIVLIGYVTFNECKSMYHLIEEQQPAEARLNREVISLGPELDCRWGNHRGVCRFRPLLSHHRLASLSVSASATSMVTCPLFMETSLSSKPFLATSI